MASSTGASRRQLLWLFASATLGTLGLSGCMTNPSAITAENARDAAHAGKAYVAFEAYMTNNGFFGAARNKYNVMFVNTTATFNPFYLRTPSNLKVQTMPPRPGAVYALDPGTYRLVFLSMPNVLSEFGMSDSPVEFTVAAGDVVYLGALQYDADKIGGFFDPNHFRLSFAVHDEFADNEAEIAKNLALLPGAPAIHTRLMTVRRAEVEVSPHPHFLGPTTATETTPAPAEPPPPAAPPPPPPDVNAPWHATPSP